MPKEEQRVCPRTDLTWPVSAPVKKVKIQGEKRNISEDGAYVCCTNPLRLNEVFDMVIDAPDKSLSIKAEVVWSNIYGPDDKINPRGMGVRFLGISEEDRKLIAQELSEYTLVKEACDFLDTLEIDLAEDLSKN